MISFTNLYTFSLLATAVLGDTTSTTSKRGAAYNDAVSVTKITGGGNTGVEYVPMLWGKGSEDFTTGIKNLLTARGDDKTTKILGFNEPDIKGQSYLSVADAVTEWQTYMTQFAKNATLISPAPTSSENADQGLNWLKSFMTECKNCNISGLAFHWYGTSADQFKTHVQEAIDIANLHNIDNVWCTEFGLNDDMNTTIGVRHSENTVAFLDEVLPWLDDQPNITHYSWFMSANKFTYFSNNNTMTDAGTQYIAN
ncbi:hypothetical protein N7462_011663 [Penicillium macrosclerotiorum]|uniref:uncharacterized protein n=1 Tax=Penicillium macrosclerotiorum TaxID=303699 RepID=UPI002547891E|nr:uncharacterized protein N7462_011663 [Penicillium macrosclerotiorum]KAJ5662737.1 hypothetical protein N7462_011663 [Penicillium macrosclerotiorum]